MKKPKIILLMPDHLGFIQIIRNNLILHGFDVIAFNQMISPTPYRYPHFGYKIIKFFRKFFLKDTNYKNKLRNPKNIQYIKEQLKDWNNYADYTLVIRPDIFTEEVLNLIKSSTIVKCVGYQWDGLSRFPEVLNRINLFDRFFVFDPKDKDVYQQLPLLAITNFCIDIFPVRENVKKNKDSLTAYFVGHHIKSRQSIVEKIVSVLIEQKVEVNFFIHHAPNNAYSNFPIKKIKQTIKFEDNLVHVQQSDILIDLVIDAHSGLSFRVFEALYFRKKLITNNISIIDYDFYHPDNVFILNGGDYKDLNNFLKKPYRNMDDIIQKYYFENWIRNILDIAPYTEITIS